MPASISTLSSRAASVDATTRGVAAMLVGMGFQVLNDAVIKLVSARLPAAEIMGLRGVLAITLALGLIFALGLRKHLRTLANPLVALRSALEAAACFSYMTALSHLGLAEFTSIVQATPLIITALAVLIGWQTVGWRRWAAVAAGFVGVLLIAKPSAHGVNLYAALALLSACFMAVRDLVTSKIPSGAPSMVVTLGSTIAVTLVGFGAGAANPLGWAIPGGLDLALIALAACLVVACNMLIVLAFRLGDMTVVGPFRYSVILGSLALGWLIWGERPDALALVGSAIIVASGLYALKREPVAAPAPAAPQG
ncbi:DMT family transporter [Chelatococcus sambhunathii]|uniref:DMT family transporter n=1 Tax=Chelatococcus sambhunathii TaxID=363953 RepID=A0ABU1DF02_9HYPH|nr:DMT family transporter [Chelatococcus sambhunathii]MDR4306613.1 DMT family transporter [Chelatococcus sambhunathii]